MPMTEKALFPDLWRELCRSQPLWAGIGPSRSWFGLDPKTFPNRLTVLFESKSLAKARSLIAPLNKDELEYLEHLAEINRRQAGLASRRTLVANISAPLGLALGLAQIFPVAVEQFMEARHGIVETSVIAVIAAIITSVLYAHIRAKQAEDLHDLIACQLSAARHEGAILTTDGI